MELGGEGLDVGPVELRWPWPGELPVAVDGPVAIGFAGLDVGTVELGGEGLDSGAMDLGSAGLDVAAVELGSVETPTPPAADGGAIQLGSEGLDVGHVRIGGESIEACPIIIGGDGGSDPPSGDGSTCDQATVVAFSDAMIIEVPASTSRWLSLPITFGDGLFLVFGDDGAHPVDYPAQIWFFNGTCESLGDQINVSGWNTAESPLDIGLYVPVTVPRMIIRLDAGESDTVFYIKFLSEV